MAGSASPFYLMEYCIPEQCGYQQQMRDYDRHEFEWGRQHTYPTSLDSVSVSMMIDLLFRCLNLALLTWQHPLQR